MAVRKTRAGEKSSTQFMEVCREVKTTGVLDDFDKGLITK
jgi:hypothetical protein